MVSDRLQKLHNNPLFAQLFSILARVRHRFSLGGRGNELIFRDFRAKSTIRCRFCNGELKGSDTIDYCYCAGCGLLLSTQPMPDYGEASLYTPSQSFVAENLAHYQRFFAAFPHLLNAVRDAGITEIVDLAGGLGLFPKLLMRQLNGVKCMTVVEVGGYAHQEEGNIHSFVDACIGFTGESRMVREDVLSYLETPLDPPSNDLLVSFIHFIDHLPEPHTLFKAIRRFCTGLNGYLFIYSHALDSYKGNEWFVINTGTPGEHQIIYSHAALKRVVNEYADIICSEIYNDDQFIFARIKGN